jgi:hypothetical protein
MSRAVCRLPTVPTLFSSLVELMASLSMTAAAAEPSQSLLIVSERDQRRLKLRRGSFLGKYISGILDSPLLLFVEEEGPFGLFRDVDLGAFWVPASSSVMFLMRLRDVDLGAFWAPVS